MADSKKYDGSQWEHSLRKQTTASEIITPPTTIYADGTAISTYSIKGNTVQNGTPTPSNPITISGVGNKTANLFSSVWEQGIIDTSGNNIQSDTTIRTKDYIAVDYNKIYSISRNITGGYINVRFYDAQKQYIGGGSASTIELIAGSSVPNPMGVGAVFCCIKIIDSNIAYMRINDLSNDLSTQYMMVEGQYTAQTMPSYEPYGQYKIPISSGGVTTPIYLNEPLMGIATADTLSSSGTLTRAYQIVELNSSMYIEAYNASWGTAFSVSVPNVSSGGEYALIDAVCTHYPTINRNTIYRSNVNGLSFSGSTNVILMNDENCATVQDFKDFITAQKNAGTPITIIVAVTTPTTETVTAPSIPTTEGANTITVDTTVQPSEFTATWTGWHDSSVKEYDGSQWQ